LRGPETSKTRRPKFHDLLCFSFGHDTDIMGFQYLGTSRVAEFEGERLQRCAHGHKHRGVGMSQGVVRPLREIGGRGRVLLYEFQA